MVEGFGDVDKLLHADVVTLENGIHVGTGAVDAAGELGHAESRLVKHFLNHVSDVYSVRLGHR